MYDALIIIGAPIVRSVAGWLNHSLEDGKIVLYEWKQLLTTTIRVGVPAVALYYGLDVPAEAAAAIPIIAEYLFDLTRKVVKEKKEPGTA